MEKNCCFYIDESTDKPGCSFLGKLILITFNFFCFNDLTTDVRLLIFATQANLMLLRHAEIVFSDGIFVLKISFFPVYYAW